ncbi:SH3 domain-containing protein [Desulfatirhabdium butyrativorans]|uniref:SH3 domain-containing protein n=1 Tax=Desulfatirhabdium butyrativorans TaxID=340467 RepID=UPI00047FE052|nr:SH3 domain-containing protein [Desulfatirhabdium butyrativorans]
MTRKNRWAFRFAGVILLMILLMPAESRVWALADRLSVTVREANVRSGPSLDSRVLWRADLYYPVQIIRKQGEWIQFRDYEGDQGWIHQSVVGPAPSVITIKENCNVRANPSLEAAVLFTLESGIPLKVSRKDGKWLYVETGFGKKGWIFDALVW